MQNRAYAVILTSDTLHHAIISYPSSEMVHSLPNSESAQTAASTVRVDCDVSFFARLLRSRELRPDVRAGIQHGTREIVGWDPACMAHQWKYTYAKDNTRKIVYITDPLSTRLIASYPEPLELASARLTREHVLSNESAKARLRDDPSLCTSHTVIVVDNSGSMRTPDVTCQPSSSFGSPEFQSRFEAVFGTLALDFVAKRRLVGDTRDTDVVSLVLMRDQATVPFEREPVGLALYNKMVSLHQGAHSNPAYHGNYLPALDKAEELLVNPAYYHRDCALSLLFLSDGRPSDTCHPSAAGSCKNNSIVRSSIAQRVYTLAKGLGQQLSVSTVGFAQQGQDLSVLEVMAAAANQAGATGSFNNTELSLRALETSIALTASTVVATKSRLAAARGRNHRSRDLRRVDMEAAGIDWGQHAHTPWEMGDGWVVYTQDVDRLEFSPQSAKRGTDTSSETSSWVSVGLSSPRANCVAIRRKALGEGAERLAFGLQEFDSRTRTFVGPKLVAKESRRVGDVHSTVAFHETFAKTQRTAKRAAERFNNKIRERLRVSAHDFDRTAVWDVSFLPCNVYTFLEADGTKRSVLAEKKLEPASRYIKWNGNNGYVRAQEASPIDSTMRGTNDRTSQKNCTEVVTERTTGLDDDGGDGAGNNMASKAGIERTEPVYHSASDMEMDEPDSEVPSAAINQEAGSSSCAPMGCAHVQRDPREALLTFGGDVGGTEGGGLCSARPLPFLAKAGCFVQAFSHFSYVYTRQKMLVCDLQGVLTSHQLTGGETRRGGVFELTDPVIHYSSNSGRDQVYGKTDLGREGTYKFFETHKCNEVCRLLDISQTTPISS